MSKKEFKAKDKFFPFEVRSRLYQWANQYGRRKSALRDVWMFMFWRSGRGNRFELAESTMLWETGYTHETLFDATRTLEKDGWLRKEKSGRGGEKNVWTVLTTGGQVAENPTVEVAEKQTTENPPPHQVADKQPSANPPTLYTYMKQDASLPTYKSICTPTAAEQPTTTTVVVDVLSVGLSVDASTPQNEKGTIAGFTPEEIQDHVARFPKGSWVWANATKDALKRPGFVAHVMNLDPPKKIAKPGTHAELNPELHTPEMAQSYTADALRFCDKCSDMHPKNQSCKPLCEDCYERHPVGGFCIAEADDPKLNAEIAERKAKARLSPPRLSA